MDTKSLVDTKNDPPVIINNKISEVTGFILQILNN